MPRDSLGDLPEEKTDALYSVLYDIIQQVLVTLLGFAR